MKFTDYILARSLWFNSVKIDCMAHKVARDLLKSRGKADNEWHNSLLNIVRRYE